MSEELFEHTTGQGKEDEDSKQEIETAQFSENLYDNKIDKDAILQAIALYHVYQSTAEDGNVVALRGLNVTVKKGEAVAVVGPSGSGKSTLLKCLGVLMKPSAGGVILNGTPTTRKTGLELVKMRQETVSFIFQEGNLLPDLSALDNVAQPLRHRDVSPYDAREKARELLIELGLEERIHGLPLFRVLCEGGTYIRNLCEDIGSALGSGGFMEQLIRTKSGPFDIENSVTMVEAHDMYKVWKETGDSNVLSSILRPLEDMLVDIPIIVAKDSAVDALCHGADLAVPGVTSLSKDMKRGQLISIRTLRDEAIALARATVNTNEVADNPNGKGKVAKLERVIMERGTYPREWKTK